MKKLFLVFLIFVLYFVPSLLVLKDYGISWDEPTHFKRGQGYLWYLLTGDNDYRKLPKYDLFRAQTDPSYHERSIYQDDVHNAAFYRTIDGSHPPLADILASGTNLIFYQKLGWMGDVESYHLYEIFVASLSVAILFIFVWEGVGLLAAVFSGILFATYPLFWAESHFNIKDPVETSWIILTIYFLWKAVKECSARYIIISSIFAGFALGTKFNVIFLPFIVLPWLVYVFVSQKKQMLSFLKKKQVLVSFLLYPVIVFGIFYFTYPFLWDNPVQNIGKVLSFYGFNALDPDSANSALKHWPLYAVRWVLYTSPPLVLTGLLLSFVCIKKNLIKNSGFLLLSVLWLLVTIARVSIPGVNIYGGVRQIMEYIPALSILASVGFSFILGKSRLYVIFLALLVALVVSIFPLLRLHPNENVYFNFLTSGLKGAMASEVPAAGNSFGNAYYQGIKWINQNATPNAKLTMIQGSPINIPKYKVRPDIDLSGDNFSGIERGGEYIIDLTFNWEHKENHYAWEYMDKFLEPVFVLYADNASILKIWKNDLDHTRDKYKFEEKNYEGNMNISNKNNKIDLELDKTYILSRLGLSYNIPQGCDLPQESTIYTSLDGRKWSREGDPLYFSQIGKKNSVFKPAWDQSGLEDLSSSEKDVLSKGKFEYFLPGRSAKFVRLELNSDNSCLINNPQIKIVYIDEN